MLVTVAELERCGRLAGRLSAGHPPVWGEYEAFARHRTRSGADRLLVAAMVARSSTEGGERLVASALVRQVEIMLERTVRRDPRQATA